MRLFLTAHSERGKPVTKSGNTHLETTFTIEQMGKNIEVVKVKMHYTAGVGYRIKVWLPKHTSTEYVLETSEHSNLYSLQDRVRDDQK